ncbi:hypothetical protein BDQ12DRAFT_472053 [Crucibulum laeve]|uniref:Uncharacterized protein n=1 Tax=Crucibulum laeve TaxID=68775 RepID=A0A5C3LIN9_9AGAR|nr:hypothetical protein BDQ12DRAFT_472053 [Crucibulum laeve]
MSTNNSTSSSVKKHNIATFAGAVGGSVGVLSIFALCLAISIIRRRRRSLKRDRLAQPNFAFVDTRHDASGGYSARARRGLLSFGRSREPRANVEDDDNESLHTDASEDAPPTMSGPAPFVPRFFPGTHVPADPPSYDSPAHAVPLASQPFSYHSPSGGLRVGGRADPVLSGVAEAYLAEDQSDDGLGEEEAGGHGMRGAGTRALTYADIPPNTPPPVMDEGVIIPAVAPPPFPVAIATPAPEQFASISGVAPASSLSTSTSTRSNNPTIPPLAHVDGSDRTTAIHPPLVLPPGISYPVIGTRARAQDEEDDSDADAASDTELLRSSSSSHLSMSHSVPESSHPTNASSSAGPSSHGGAARVGAGVLSSAVGMSALPPYSESPSARTSISEVARPANLDIVRPSPPTALSGPIRTHLDRVITRVASANDVSVHSGPERPRSRVSMRSLRARAREQEQSSEDST